MSTTTALPHLLINTSWDDGPLEDLALAPLLARHGIPAIYFLPAENPQRPCLDARQIRELSQMGEVGSHAYHHVALTTLTAAQCRDEMVRSKAFLEDATGRPVETFCYPWGDTNAQVARIVAEHYRSARRAGIMSLRPPSGFHVDGTFHFTYRARTNLVKEVLAQAPLALKPRLLSLVAGRYRMIDVVRALLDHATRRPGERFLLHLWGHAWEIEKFGLWDEMREICALLADYREFFVDYTRMPASGGSA